MPLVHAPRKKTSPPAPQREHQVQRAPALELKVARQLVVAHLLAAVDEALLRRRDALLLLDALLDLLHGEVGLDVKLDLAAGQRSDPGGGAGRDQVSFEAGLWGEEGEANLMSIAARLCDGRLGAELEECLVGRVD